jgi:hypothetical protein
MHRRNEDHKYVAANCPLSPGVLFFRFCGSAGCWSQWGIFGGLEKSCSDHRNPLFGQQQCLSSVLFRKWKCLVVDLCLRPQGNDEKIAFLQELRDISGACPGPWFLASDFNLIYKDEDKNNSQL